MPKGIKVKIFWDRFCEYVFHLPISLRGLENSKNLLVLEQKRKIFKNMSKVCLHSTLRFS